MTTKRKIKAKEIVSDIRTGMNPRQLMDKYFLTPRGLQNIFQKLRDAHVVEETELEPFLRSLENEPGVEEEPEPVQRCFTVVRLPIYDLNNLLVEGFVSDINETALQVSGLPAQIGEEKELLIQADSFAEVFPFTFLAQCTWVSHFEEEHWFAGFTITNISEGGLQEWRKVINMLTVCE